MAKLVSTGSVDDEGVGQGGMARKASWEYDTTFASFVLQSIHTCTI